MNKNLKILVLFLIIIVVGLTVYFVIDKNQKNKEGEFTDWKTYQNEAHGFEFRYPQNWVVIKEGVGEYSWSLYDILIQDKKGKYFHPQAAGSEIPKIEDCEDCLDEGGVEVNVYVMENNENLDVEILIGRNEEFFSDKSEFVLNTVNGIAVWDIYSAGAGGDDWKIPMEKYVFSLSYHIGKGKLYDSSLTRQEVKNIFNQILSTFKFLD